MTRLNNTYPKEMTTIEKATENSDEKQVVTVVNNDYEERAVLAAIDYMDAFNEGDAEKMSACINYPHARVGANGELVISERPDGETSPGFFEGFRKRYGWNHSCWDSREVIQSIENKVHLIVTFSRYRVDGSRIGTFPSIWVMTKQDDHWAIKMRSSFAL